jgi:hypothetical protein
MKLPKGVTLEKAEYVKDYKFSFTFSDGIISVVDFEPVINQGTMCLEFLDIEKFKQINISKPNDDIYWGEDWTMCFHIWSIFKEKEVR